MSTGLYVENVNRTFRRHARDLPGIMRSEDDVRRQNRKQLVRQPGQMS
jgi:hypothetical protein